MFAAPDPPFPSAVELVLQRFAPLVDARGASAIGFEAAVKAMAPATKAAITADLKCYLAWCTRRRPVVMAVPAEPETLVHYLNWLAKGSDTRRPAKPATLARRIASIARVHRILGFGEKEALPTQAGMVRDTLKGIRRDKRQRQRQAAPLRLGEEMAEGQGAPEGVTIKALLASCGSDTIGLRDAALISLAYDAGLRVSELVGTQVADLRQVGDGSGRLDIAYSKTDQLGEGAKAWLSPDTMARVSAWLLASGLSEGPVFRRINVLTSPPDAAGQQIVRHYIGAKPLTRQGVVALLRRRVLEAVDLGHVEFEPGMEGDAVRGLSAHSFRVGLTQDLFAAGEDGAGIALALRWSSPTTALRYARELAVGSNAAARVLGKMRGAA
ncbi:tyrosine-type recombinase/integrase [Sphingomonas sp. IC081]|uniref:tyrosine-type recombinase/integrase n=1 Tax=Sphingomonas sp. IC081 TaxID=304378 RepID=UPI001159CD9B|nr:tyrosine-type recombinase/integrase [Sphingomonas sp. IC081]QDK35914.1 integrase [Sphingomonas sp. IC081]QDK35971.1 integrase [Sphingomonas sp. IC081]